MKRILSEYNIEVVEIPRKKQDEVEISASKVRACMIEGDYDTIRRIVPESTLRYLLSDDGQKLAARMREENHKA